VHGDERDDTDAEPGMHERLGRQSVSRIVHRQVRTRQATT